MNNENNYRQYQYTNQDIFRYIYTLLIFMFFTVFTFSDLNEDISYFAYRMKILSTFPYALMIINCGIFSIKKYNKMKSNNTYTDELDYTVYDVFALFIFICTIGFIMISISLGGNSITNKVFNIFGLIIYLLIYSQPKKVATTG